MDRREFVSAAALTAASATRVLGANDRIGIGLIGCGDRGIKAHLNEAVKYRETANIEFRAVCDVFTKRAENAAEIAKANSMPNAKIYRAYRELLADKNIDAVIIATPDHQHSTMLTDAVRAGKDVYVEKPLAMDMKELLTAVDAVKKTDRIVQMGTQIRSLPSSMAAKKFVTGGGLGKVFKIEQERNSAIPYWFRKSDTPITENDLDWRSFVFNRKPRPFDPDVVTSWYGYREFSRGPHSNLMVHFIDLAHHVTGVSSAPSKVIAMGGSFVYKDAHTAPDSVETILEYPEGFMVRYSTACGTREGNYLKFFGTRGTLDASNWNGKPFAISGAGSPAEDRIKPGDTIPEMEHPTHMMNWLECLRTRKQPNAPIDSGYTHSVAVIMADEAMIRGRRMIFDPQKRAIREG